MFKMLANADAVAGAGSADADKHYVTSTESCMFHPGKIWILLLITLSPAETSLGTDLGYVGAGMPTTEIEAQEFAANVADPVRHLKGILEKEPPRAGEGHEASVPASISWPLFFEKRFTMLFRSKCPGRREALRHGHDFVHVPSRSALDEMASPR
jgi:hypothetical protein